MLTENTPQKKDLLRKISAPKIKINDNTYLYQNSEGNH